MSWRRVAIRVVGVLVVVALLGPLGPGGVLTTSPAAAKNPITPGVFTGLGFDQCEAPDQASMDRWWKKSPFEAVGIYISGSLRFCQAQTHLTPEWVRRQLATGWRLLPIHLGPQASCTDRERYRNIQIKPKRKNNFELARAQGRAEARIAVAAAKRLGIVERSTIYYDLEHFPMNDKRCQTSALWFLHAWTKQLHKMRYASGVYSSGSSGIRMLDDARVKPNSPFQMPDQLWIAEWNGKATVDSMYVRPDGWVGRRLHQFTGGHPETWGGVTINIDRNYLELTVPPRKLFQVKKKLPVNYKQACRPATIHKLRYGPTHGTKNPRLIHALQCELARERVLGAKITGRWNRPTRKAVKRFQRLVEHQPRAHFAKKDWMRLHVRGVRRVQLAPGMRHKSVIGLKRALNTATNAKLKVDRYYGAKARRTLIRYQKRVGITPQGGVVDRQTWRALANGKR